MTTILMIVIIILLAFIAWEDFRHQAFNWVWIPLLTIAVFFLLKAEHIDFDNFWSNTFINVSIIAIQLLFLTAYFSVKEKILVNIIDRYIGLGDVLLLGLLAFMLTPVNFIIITIMSMFLMLIAALIYGALKRNLKNISEFKVPLAGGISLVLIGCFSMKIINNFNFYEDIIDLTKILA